MNIGSLCSGIGGLDLAAEWVTGGRTVWQIDHDPDRASYGAWTASVRRRHWPDADQHPTDLRDLDPRDMPPVDVLCAGFPCQDLSAAGKGEGLSGRKSGLYFDVLRWIQALEPRHVILENVPRLLSGYRARIESDLRALGYGVTWAPLAASHVGAPHRRSRVFVIATRGQAVSRMVEAPPLPRGDLWATPLARDWKGGCGDGATWARGWSRPLPNQVARGRGWPTPTKSDAGGSGATAHALARGCIGTLTDAAVGLSPCAWPTPTKTSRNKSESYYGGGRLGTLHDEAVACRYGPRADPTRRASLWLNPAWVECLMGYPQGWTDPDAPAPPPVRDPQWPAPLVRGLWHQSPQHEWEPPRSVPRSTSVPHRTDRLRGLGNAVCPQQGAEALRRALQPVQPSLFG